MTSGQKYYIVAGCNAEETGSYTLSISETPPVQPTGLTAGNITGTSVKLTWSASSQTGAGRWLIQYRVSGGTWTDAGTTSSTYYTVSGLTELTSYEFRVYGKGVSGTLSDASNTATAKTLPPQPIEVAVDDYTDTTVKLTWNTSFVNGIDRWLIQYRKNSGTWTNLGTSTYKGYSASGFVPNATYEFRIYSETGSPAWSGTRSVASSTVSVTLLPQKPYDLAVTDYTDTTVKLTWKTASVNGTERWLIQYRKNSGSWVNATTSTSKECSISGLTPNAAYEFRVYGERGSPAWSGVRSPVSNTVSVILLPQKPYDLTVTDYTDTTVKLTWKTASVNGTERWLIQYRKNSGSWTNATTSTSKECLVSGLTPNATYEFRVYGERGSPAWSGVRSPVSNTVSVKTSSADPTVQQILDNIQSSQNIPSEKKAACKAVAQEMLNSGFEVSFIAGLLSNLCKEGTIGIFEYYNSSVPYHINLDSYLQTYYGCTYKSEYSGKYIYDKNLTTVYNLFTDLSNMDWTYNGGRIGTGLGCMQWTFGRTYTLINIYREVTGNSSSISMEQATTAECLMISRELSGSHIEVYSEWKTANASSLNTLSAAYSASKYILTGYEKPLDQSESAIDLRGELAQKIYSDLIK